MLRRQYLKIVIYERLTAIILIDTVYYVNGKPSN